MSVKLFDNHTPRCEYCQHVRWQNGSLLCVRRRTEATKPCSSFMYDPLKRIPRQEARLPEYRPEDFMIDSCEEELDSWQQDAE